MLHDLYTVCISVIKFLFIESKISPGAMIYVSVNEQLNACFTEKMARQVV